jgi:hypothetical protein
MFIIIFLQNFFPYIVYTMKLKALHLFLILLASLLFCSCLGQFTVEGMSGSRINGDTIKSSATDTIKDSVKDSIKDSVKDSVKSSIANSDISGLVAGINRTPPQANISGDTYSPDSSDDGSGQPNITGDNWTKIDPSAQSTSDLSSDTALSSTSSPASYPASPSVAPTPAQPSAQPTYPPAPTDYSQSPSGSLGIPRSQIASGSEDLYILKSEVIPPVCPACPTMSACPRQEPCTPCPPCARCPEPSFQCKKVPNYSTNDDSYLPRPVLADFSQFGA